MADTTTTTTTASESVSVAPQQYQLLSAKYESPSNAAFTHTTKLATPKSSNTADRTAYLGALRKATAQLQAHINAELTLRMDEDKAREAAATSSGEHTGGGGALRGVVDDSKEEDNYGEEVPEED